MLLVSGLECNSSFEYICVVVKVSILRILCIRYYQTLAYVFSKSCIKYLRQAMYGIYQSNVDSCNFISEAIS